MNTLKITPPEGFEIDKEKSTFEEIVFKPIKKELPRKWEDLGFIKGWFVNHVSQTFPIEMSAKKVYRNIFATEEQARAAVALAQLSQLREVYRQEWTPDWNNGSQTKYSIANLEGKTYKNCAYRYGHFLCFQSEEVRDEFLENFKDLIEEASPLLFGWDATT